jgi:hypothetical protein
MKATKILILIASMLLVACFDDPGTDIVWGDDAYLELDRAGQPNPTVSNTYERLNNGTKYAFSSQINIMGKPQTKDVTVNFTITGTAVAGVHYNNLSGNSITIPAGSNVATLNFEHLADNINSGETWTLIITLTGGDLPLSKYVVVTHNLRVLCAFNRTNFLGNYSTLEPGYGTYTTVSTPHATITNAIVISNFWDFGGIIRYEFSTALGSNTVTLPTQTTIMGGTSYTVAANGPATYDACTFSFTVPYRVTLTSNGSLQDTNVHTFTHQ